MTQYHVTVDEAVVHKLFSGNDRGLAELLQQVLNQILQAQRDEALGAGPYERTEQRRGYRNGYKPRKLVTRVGALTLRVPQVREGEFSPELFQRYQRSEQALVLALMEMVINGVSTRKVARITEELCGVSFPKSTVSDLCKRLDLVVRAWNQRDLSDRTFPFVQLDAVVLRIRDDDRVRSQSGLLATGVNEDGYREVLGLMIGDSESEASWSTMLRWLKDRGLRGVDFVTSDDHGGLVKAIHKHLQSTTWQRCQTHFMRNILDACPKTLQPEIHRHVRSVLDAPDQATARVLLQTVLGTYGDRAPRAMAILEQGFEDATAVLALPEPYRKRLRTTNGLERLIEEIRRRERVIRIFPNQASAERLLGALLMEIDEAWSTGRRYFDMQGYYAWKRAREEAASEERSQVA